MEWLAWKNGEPRYYVTVGEMLPEDAAVLQYMLTTEEAKRESNEAFEAAKIAEQISMALLLKRSGM